MLYVNDVIICNKYITFVPITYEKEYVVQYTRSHPEKDLCIKDDLGYDWWLGQIGSTECWTNWFITKKEFQRNKKIEFIIEDL